MKLTEEALTSSGCYCASIPKDLPGKKTLLDVYCNWTPRRRHLLSSSDRLLRLIARRLSHQHLVCLWTTRVDVPRSPSSADGFTFPPSSNETVPSFSFDTAPPILNFSGSFSSLPSSSIFIYIYIFNSGLPFFLFFPGSQQTASRLWDFFFPSPVFFFPTRQYSSPSSSSLTSFWNETGQQPALVDTRGSRAGSPKTAGKEKGG